ncbi:MAG: hypothetical protein M1281_10360 [Chloroflexi bacterium]|nr:hypothetical protein [Chloroflexota bacterium]
MIPPEHQHALRILLDGLSGQAISWAVTGSLGFALQGMDVPVHDIDLQTNRIGAYQIEERFHSYLVRPVAFSPSDKVQSYLGRMEIDGIVVELMGDLQKRLKDGAWEAPVNVDDYKIFVAWQDRQVPVLSLEYEVQAYRLMGRMEKVKLLEEFLKRKHSQSTSFD